MKLFFVTLLLCLVAFQSAPANGETQATTKQAVAEYQSENYEEALATLLAARASEGASPLNDYYTGLCRKQTGELAEAEKSFRDALKGAPPVGEDASIELISILIGRDRIDEAMVEIDRLEKNRVRSKEIAYLKGLALAKQKSYDAAIASFQQSRTGEPRTDQQVDLQIAMALAQSGNIESSRESLKSIITSYPGTDTASFAAEYNQRIAAMTSGKNWNVFANINYLYDSNVTLESRISGASPARNEKSGGIAESLRLEYDATLNSNWSANFQYLIQNNNYLRIPEYSSLTHGATVNLIKRNESLILSFPVNVSHATLDYRNYSLQGGFKPTATIIFTPNQFGQVSVGYNYRDMYYDLAGSENNRNAHTINGQIGYIYLFANSTGMVNIRGEFSYEDTKGSAWRNFGSRIGADLLIPLSQDTKLILTAEGLWQNYPDSSANRKDTTLTTSASVNQKIINNLLYANLQYYYTREISNVATYDHKRSVYSAGLELRF